MAPRLKTLAACARVKRSGREFETNTKGNMQIKYADGRDVVAASEDEALEIIRAEYPNCVTCENGWESSNFDGSVERLLVWRNESEAEGDGGQKAVAQIIRRLHTYHFSSDSGSATIEASSPDEAAWEFDDDAQTMAELMDKIAKVGGYITVTEDGLVIERISEDGVRL